jgi:ABC-type Mn2+/Zn2+ transport system ATPase subunit
MPDKSEAMKIILEVSSGTFGYAKRRVIHVEKLQICSGECLGIFGPNGAGKTTMIRGISGLIPPMSGKVHRPIQSVRFGYIPQQRQLALQWPMSGYDAACLALSTHQMFGWIGKKNCSSVVDSMKSLSVDHLADKPFAKLSGGQQQRILLAGAMAAKPDVLILDEPTDGLDVRSRRELIDLLSGICRSGVSILLISHQIDLIQLSHRIAWLHVGESSDDPTELEMIAPQQLMHRLEELKVSNQRAEK